jgi:hypothetical protein
VRYPFCLSQEPKSTLLLVHLASVILKTVAVFVLMYRMSLWVAAAQDRVAADRLSRPEGRTVFLSDVPGGASAGAHLLSKSSRHGADQKHGFQRSW